MGELFSEQLRQAIERSGMSRYAIGQAAGIDKATMSRFMAGKVGLSLESIDKIVDVLRLKLVGTVPQDQENGDSPSAKRPVPLTRSLSDKERIYGKFTQERQDLVRPSPR